MTEDYRLLLAALRAWNETLPALDELTNAELLALRAWDEAKTGYRLNQAQLLAAARVLFAFAALSPHLREEMQRPVYFDHEIGHACDPFALSVSGGAP